MERVEWIDSKEQIADCLTKVGGKEKLLLEYISTTKEEKERKGRLMDD